MRILWIVASLNFVQTHETARSNDQQPPPTLQQASCQKSWVIPKYSGEIRSLHRHEQSYLEPTLETQDTSSPGSLFGQTSLSFHAHLHKHTSIRSILSSLIRFDQRFPSYNFYLSCVFHHLERWKERRKVDGAGLLIVRNG